jgi:cell division protein FtsX
MNVGTLELFGCIMCVVFVVGNRTRLRMSDNKQYIDVYNYGERDWCGNQFFYSLTGRNNMIFISLYFFSIVLSADVANRID